MQDFSWSWEQAVDLDFACVIVGRTTLPIVFDDKGNLLMCEIAFLICVNFGGTWISNAIYVHGVVDHEIGAVPTGTCAFDWLEVLYCVWVSGVEASEVKEFW
ncbi:unnamed protein product [Rhizophagus irregularis]|nr:unnamed protein product [Rhizophagus irregularis]